MKTSALVLLFGLISAAVFGSNAAPYETSYQQCSYGNSVNVNCIGSVIRFTSNISNIGSRCIESPEITLNNLLWNVKICYENSAAWAYLESSSNDKASNWTCDARATIKVLPRNNNHERIFVKQLPSYRYSESKTNQRIQLMSWTDFTNHYVTENEVNFEIGISTIPVRSKSPPSMNQISTTFLIPLDDVNNLTEINSSVVIVQGVKWRVQVRKSNQNLSLYLIADDENDFGLGTFYSVEAYFKLLTFNINTKPIVKNFTHNYSWGNLVNGIDEFLSWSTFTESNSNFITQNKARIVVQLNVGEPQSTLWDTDEYNISATETPEKCSKCAKEFSNGIIYSRCGHKTCESCYLRNPNQNCGNSTC